ncbi:MAG: DUF1634 domain-containing protein [Actinobacteria bacterium]|nr:DUF1634 domain-containing protein [Actinomycetota bacterium]
MSMASWMGEHRTAEEQDARREESRQIEVRIATILRTGVVAAAVLLTISMPWIVFEDRTDRFHRLSVGEALRRLPDLDPRGLAALGVIILVATPVLQLLTSAFLFWRKHDRLYVGLTLTVCAIVAFGALFTTGGH